MNISCEIGTHSYKVAPRFMGLIRLKMLRFIPRVIRPRRCERFQKHS